MVGSGVITKRIATISKRFAYRKQHCLLGERKDIPDILKSFDIFVFPSLREGLPGALMEAMAAGIACIATNIDEKRGTSEDEKHGLLIQPQNVLRFPLL